MERIYGGIYSICEWVMRLFYVNILWILFTILGLGIMGIFPATIAMFAVTRRWLRGDPDCPIFSTFWSSFKTEFWKSQLIGVTISSIGIFLYFGQLISKQNEGILNIIATILSNSFLLLFVSVVLYLLPLFVHVQLTTGQYFRNSLIISISNLSRSIVMIVVSLIGVSIMIKFPGLILFFGGSIVAVWVTWNAQRAFDKLGQKISYE